MSGFARPRPPPSLAYSGHLPHFYGCNLESSRSYAATWSHSREWDECPMLSSLVHICAICYQQEAWPRSRSLRLWCPSAVVIINANSWGAKNSRDLAWCHHTTPRGCGKTSRAACIGPHIGYVQTGPYRMSDQAIERECVRPVKGVRGINGPKGATVILLAVARREQNALVL